MNPIVPAWIPFFGGFPVNSPIVGSFLAIVVSVFIAISTIILTGRSNRRHVEALEKASADQIKETRYWIDLKRKQLLKSLIQELKLNIRFFEAISKGVQNRYDEFSLSMLENCLTDTPIDNDRRNFI